MNKLICYFLTFCIFALLNNPVRAARFKNLGSSGNDGVNMVKPNIHGPFDIEVNSFTGNLLLQRNDLFIPGRGVSLEATFSYNSGLSANDWGLGKGWTSNFNMLYERAPGYVLIRKGDGRKDIFSGTGPYAPPVGVHQELSEYSPGKFLLRTKHGVKYFFDDSTHKHLTKIEDPDGNTVQFTNFNAGNQPQYIIDPSGRTIRIEWTGGQLSQVIDSVSSPERTTSYEYDVCGNLVRTTDQAGNIVHYQYDAQSRLVKVTDKRSNIATITYNDSGAVSEITSPGSTGTAPISLSFTYDLLNNKTMVDELVNAVTQTTTYTFDGSSRAVRIQGNCCGFDKQYQYDASNNITRVTDANGNQSVFTYDSTGNRITETDAMSHVASWTYEHTYNHVTSFTDKRGNTTNFSYDSHGNLVSRLRPLGVTESFTYDAFGNITSATDGNGSTTTYTYDTYGEPTAVAHAIGSESFSYDNSGNIISWTDANGHTTTYTYDLLNRRITMTDPLPATTTYAYDANDNLISETDANGHATTYSYDAHNRVIAVTTPAGSGSLVRDSHGNILQTTDLNGNLREYSYDVRNRPVSMTDPLGHSRTTSYDNNGNTLSQTDFNGNLTAYEYDALDRMVKVTDALGNPTSYSYDNNGNLSTMTDANAHTTSYVYDALDRQTQVNHPSGSESFTYDNNGNLVSETDPNGHTMSHTYDGNSRLRRTVGALSDSTRYSYDSKGNLISLTDPNGLISSYSYDAVDRMVTSSNPMSEVTTSVYDAVGNKTSMSLPNGNVITYSYDASDRPISLSDLLGTLQSTTYDANSNRLTLTDGNGYTRHYLYDQLDRLTSASEPLGQSTLYSYDNNSNIVSVTDDAGNATTYTYDALNRRVGRTFPGGATTSGTFDNVGNLLSILDGKGNSTSFLYDAMDRPTKTTYANSSSRQFSYDLAGNMTSLVDQNGTSITYAYDPLDRLTSRNYPGGSDAFTYDIGGRLLTANNSHATESFSYDAAGRIVSEVINGKTTSHSYNIPGRSRTTVYPGGRVVQESYDVRSMLTTLQSGATTVATYTYDPESQLLAQNLVNGVRAGHAYDDNGWEKNTNHYRGVQMLAQYVYNYDARGFRTTVEKLHRPSHSEKYDYSAAPRLTSYKEGTLTGGNIPSPLTQTQFVFDAIGNRTSSVKDTVTTTYTSNNINAYTAVSGGISLIPMYDANGNMKSDGFRQFIYDYSDRLAETHTAMVNYFYWYDALGRRIEKIVNGIPTIYYYDGDNVIEERDISDAVTATYVHGQGTDNMVSMTKYSPTRDYYYHQNSLGSVIAMTDSSGNVVERYEYDAFGKVSMFDSIYTPLSTSSIGNNYLFTGRELDAETGLYYYRARHYMPEIGRFMQQDPLLWGDEPDIRNGYSYVGNNPINSKDPTGLEVVGVTKSLDNAGNSATCLWYDDGYVKCTATCAGGDSHLYWCKPGDGAGCGGRSIDDWCGASAFQSTSSGGRWNNRGMQGKIAYAAIKEQGMPGDKTTKPGKPTAAIKEQGMPGDKIKPAKGTEIKLLPRDTTGDKIGKLPENDPILRPWPFQSVPPPLQPTPTPPRSQSEPSFEASCSGGCKTNGDCGVNGECYKGKCRTGPIRGVDVSLMMFQTGSRGMSSPTGKFRLLPRDTSGDKMKKVPENDPVLAPWPFPR